MNKKDRLLFKEQPVFFYTDNLSVLIVQLPHPPPPPPPGDITVTLTVSVWVIPSWA